MPAIVISLQTVFNYLADAICLLIKFDGIFEQSQLKSLWPHYVNTIKLAEKNQQRLHEGSQKTGDDANDLSNFFLKIDLLISGNLFQVFFDIFVMCLFVVTSCPA